MIRYGLKTSSEFDGRLPAAVTRPHNHRIDGETYGGLIINGDETLLPRYRSLIRKPIPTVTRNNDDDLLNQPAPFKCVTYNGGDNL